MMEKNEKQSVTDDAKLNLLTCLSEDFICEILCRTSPLEASRFSVISKVFKCAADSDVVWERFLPLNYLQILSRSVSSVAYGSKKQLFFTLCDSPILLDYGQSSFSLDRKSGKKSFMLGARLLSILGVDTPEWEYTTHSDSRIWEVAELKSCCLLDIRGKISSQMLSPETIYSAYLVFKTASRLYGFEYVNTVIRLVNYGEHEIDGEERGSTVHLQQAHAVYRSASPPQMGRFPVSRGDGWMEIEIGDIFNKGVDDGEVEARVMEVKRLNSKSGLIVQGIEFRPKPRFT